MTKTHKKYFPPIPAKVTESFTKVSLILSEISRASESDICDHCRGYKEEFGNVVIYPGDFHVMMENVQGNMDSYVCSFIRFLFNIACGFQR